MTRAALAPFLFLPVISGAPRPLQFFPFPPAGYNGLHGHRRVLFLDAPPKTTAYSPLYCSIIFFPTVGKESRSWRMSFFSPDCTLSGSFLSDRPRMWAKGLLVFPRRMRLVGVAIAVASFPFGGEVFFFLDAGANAFASGLPGDACSAFFTPLSSI